MPISNLHFQNFGENIQGSWKQLNQCNILVVGNTGVGKTTLIGHVLNIIYDNPITTEIESYKSRDFTNLTLYDTQGFERQTKSSFGGKNNKKNFFDLIEKQKKYDKEPIDHIHMVWYCFNAQTTRPSEIDADFIEKIDKKEIPVILVRTRSYDTNTKRNIPLEIAELEVNLPVKELVLILAKDEQTIGGTKLDNFGLDTLKEVTEDCLNDVAEKAFLDSAKAKKDKAISSLTLPLVRIAVAQGIISGIPGVKPFIISPLQILLAKNISKIFGYEATFSESEITEYIKVASLAFLAFLPDFDDYLKDKFPIDEETQISQTLEMINSWISKNVDKIPFTEELGQVISNIINFSSENRFFSLLEEIPLLKIISSFQVFITTLAFGLIWIESLKERKLKEYQEGQDISNEIFEEIIADKVDDIKRLIRLIFGSPEPGL